MSSSFITTDPGDITDPVKVSNDFFDNDVIHMIVTNSELYARSKGNNTFISTTDEMRAFLGVLLASGYSLEPRRYLYWTLADDVLNKAIVSSFTRNRFEEIMKYIQLSDNARLDVGDKMVKVSPLLSMINERFLRYFASMKQ